ncbi:MAG: hypothetical protein ACO1QS_18655 [Verrucomicrobiota bacterium]
MLIIPAWAVFFLASCIVDNYRPLAWKSDLSFQDGFACKKRQTLSKHRVVYPETKSDFTTEDIW